MKKFREKGFVIDNVEEFYKKSKELDEIIKKLEELKRKNKVLMNKYRGDKKFVRVHKRISEENKKREKENESPVISTDNEDIMNMLNNIKDDVDKKVYDRNDILKKDAYFNQTVMTEVSKSIKNMGFSSAREDRDFIKSRIVKEYMSQYKETYFI